MNIGDKVRLLMGKEEGIITRFLDQDLVEIEIEDGFKIPVLKREVVVVAKEEADYFEGKVQPANVPVQNAGKQMLNAQSGIYMAFVEINDKVLSVHVINNTQYEVPFIVGEEGQVTKGIVSGKLIPYSAQKVTERIVQEFDQWPLFYIQLLFFQKGKYDIKEPLQKRLKFNANSFFRSKKLAPVISQKAFLFQIDGEVKAIDPQVLKEQMFQKHETNEKEKEQKIGKPLKEVDLHIENLIDNHRNMSNGEILQLQIQTFEKTLDQAIASGMDEIIFIHGAGNGVLKNAIHKILSNSSGIKFYKDARKEKFGYGATIVGIN
jgi:hypothetical protein